MPADNDADDATSGAAPPSAPAAAARNLQASRCDDERRATTACAAHLARSLLEIGGGVASFSSLSVRRGRQPADASSTRASRRPQLLDVVGGKPAEPMLADHKALPPDAGARSALRRLAHDEPHDGQATRRRRRRANDDDDEQTTTNEMLTSLAPC